MNQTKTMPRPIKTALHQAIIDHRIHQVRLLVRQFPHLLNIRDVYGQTPLTVACRLEDENISNKIAKILISSGTEVGHLDNNQRSALSYVAQNGRVVIARRILKQGISMDLAETDKIGNTSLHLAAEAGQSDIVDILIDEFFTYHLDIDCPNNDGFTPLLLACKNNNYVSAYILLTKGNASPNNKDRNHELDAAGWIHKTDKQMFLHTANDYTPLYQSVKRSELFSRNRIMYERSITPICRHHVQEKKYMNPTRHNRLMKETVIENGSDAQRAVLDKIVSVTKHSRPISTNSCKTVTLFKISDKMRLRKSCIDTMINHLFRIYSEQQLTQDTLQLAITISSHKNCNSSHSQPSRSASTKTTLPFIKISS